MGGKEILKQALKLRSEERIFVIEGLKESRWRKYSKIGVLIEVKKSNAAVRNG